MADTPTSEGGILSWLHSDPRGLAAPVDSAFARARSRDWRNDDDSLADLRALVMNVFAATSALGDVPPKQTGETLSISPYPNSSRPDNRAVQDACMRGLAVFLAKNPKAVYTLRSNERIETEGGARTCAVLASASDTAVFPWLGAVAIVAVVGAIAAIVSDWLGSDQIKAIQIATDANVQKHAAALANTTQLIEAHLEREKEAGHPLPWDAAEQAELDELRASTKALAAWKAEGVKPVSVAGALEEIAKGVGKGAEGAGIGAGVALAVAAAWFLSQQSSRHERRAAA